jgi:hypothetical protein
MGGFLSGIGGFFESVDKDAVHDGQHLWNTAVKDAKAGAQAVATAVRSTDAANAKSGSWFDKEEQYVEHEIDQGRTWLSKHGGVAGKVASNYIGFNEGVAKSLYDTGKGLVQVSNNVQALENPLEWATNPGANIARLKAGAQAVEGLGKLANLTSPTGWIADSQGNERMASALWQSAKKNFEADPSEATGYVVGTVAQFFIPVGGEAAAAGDVTKAAEVGGETGEIVDAANAGRVGEAVAERGPAEATFEAPTGMGSIEAPRTPGLGERASMSELVQQGAVPGSEGVILTDRVADPSELYSGMFRLSQQNGVEYALTREDDELVLRSGAPDKVAIPKQAESLAHTHPFDPETELPQTMPSRADVNVLNLRWNVNPDGPRPSSDIIWGSGSDQVTRYHASGLDPIPDPTKGGLKPRRSW